MLDRQLYGIITRALSPEEVQAYPREFAKRVIVQKALYLLTHGRGNPKVSLPYSWTFYLRGPYSPEVAHMLYYMNNFLQNLDTNAYTLTTEELAAVNHFQALKKQVQERYQVYSKNSSDELEEFFEILATLTYIAEQLGKGEEQYLTIFKRLKPQLVQKYSETLIKDLCRLLEKFQYI